MTQPPHLTFEALLDRGEPLLLDGGLATQLEAMGHAIDTPLWSAELLASSSESILAAHIAFLEAGADGVISASYQLSRTGLTRVGVEEKRFEELLRLSVELADQARRQVLQRGPERDVLPFVAASVGPFGAALADGSEYRGDYGVDDATLRAFHAERLEILDDSGADVLACETIPSHQEARVLHELLEAVATGAWVSFSCKSGTRLNDGSSLRACAQSYAGHPRVLALGVNCTSPSFITEAIGELRSGAPDKRVVVYPNSGEAFDENTRRWCGSSDATDYRVAAKGWREAGAAVIGGCCRTGPAHIRSMRAGLGRL